MKKPNRSSDLNAKKKAPSKGLGIDFDDMDDEVIDLEEIVELPGGGDEDHLDFDVELLDAESDLDLTDLDTKLSDGETDDLLSEDILKEFSFSEEEDLEPDMEKELGLDMKRAGGKNFETMVDFDDDILAGLGKEAEGSSLADMDFSMEPPPPKAAAPAAAKAAPVGRPPGGPSMDEVVSRIEDRLVEAVREIVEARLPEIVRDVLREEIDRLKAELK